MINAILAPRDAIDDMAEKLECLYTRAQALEESRDAWRSECRDTYIELSNLERDLDEHRRGTADLVSGLRDSNMELRGRIRELEFHLQERKGKVMLGECMEALMPYWKRLPFGMHVDALLNRGNTIGAIKFVRNMLGIGFREAKELVGARRKHRRDQEVIPF